MFGEVWTNRGNDGCGGCGDPQPCQMHAVVVEVADAVGVDDAVQVVPRHVHGVAHLDEDAVVAVDIACHPLGRLPPLRHGGGVSIVVDGCARGDDGLRPGGADGRQDALEVRSVPIRRYLGGATGTGGAPQVVQAGVEMDDGGDVDA